MLRSIADTLADAAPSGAPAWVDVLPAVSRDVARREAAMTRRYGLCWFVYPELRRIADDWRAATPVALRMPEGERETENLIARDPFHGRDGDDRRLPVRGPPDVATE